MLSWNLELNLKLEIMNNDFKCLSVNSELKYLCTSYFRECFFTQIGSAEIGNKLTSKYIEIIEFVSRKNLINSSN
ncbi:hypothetical protein CWI39_1599p0010 [Hamiltosporidium magnivora]|uniref:Uncharacterized protein n=1 Tax=Hamiltosporidium magnivora TaxID=148818 RepID=A0A4Q9L0Z7_9MICR|nr:hypothetical protein CWI39_1599p0010 [Hamiltosporidium magnivora]